MKCQWQGCDKDATHHPKICVPATGVPVDTHQPLSCMIGLQACKEHVLQFNAKDFLDRPTPNGNFKNRDVFALLARGRADPDFDRSFIIAVPLDCEEAKNFRATISSRPDATNQSVLTGG